MSRKHLFDSYEHLKCKTIKIDKKTEDTMLIIKQSDEWICFLEYLHSQTESVENLTLVV